MSKEYVTADLANIEGRVNAWLAGEQWKLQAFRDYDTITGTDAKGEPIRKGRDLYFLTAEALFNMPPGSMTDKHDPRRQSHGKVPELACGYQGALGAFHNMAKNYGVYLPDKEILIAVGGWRKLNPFTVKSWWTMQDAAFEAVGSPGNIVWLLDKKLAFVVHDKFLWMRLPSGRLLAYCRPEIRNVTRLVHVKDDEGNVVLDDDGKPLMEPITRESVTFWAVNSKTRKWQRNAGYGGYWCENAVQAISRDILVEAMFRVEECSYPIVLHAHDELVSEVDEGFGSVQEFEQLLAQVPVWAEGCPISAAGWRGRRYRK